MPSILDRLLPGLTAVVVAMLLFPVRSSSTSYIYNPLTTQVEKADLIVIGKVIRDTPGYYKTPYNGCGRAQAVLTVTEVLRGKFESPRAERMLDGAYVQTVRVRHYEELKAEDGNFHVIVMDQAYKDTIEGIWFLQRSDIPGIYCIDSPSAERLDQLATVRKCIRSLDSEYSGHRNGFLVDDRTWLTTFGGSGRFASEHVNVCVLPDGTAFVEGTMDRELYVSDSLSLSVPGYDAFLARLGADGSVRWLRALGGEQLFDVRPVAGLDGSCVLVGEMNRPCKVFGTIMPWSGGRSQLLTGISQEGKVRWALTVTERVYPEDPPRLSTTPSLPGRTGRVTGITVTAGKDAYYMIASFTGEVVFGGRNYVAEHDRDWLVTTIGAEGQIVDTRQITHDSKEDVKQLAVRSDGLLIVGGDARSPDSFSDAFVTAISSDGKEVWTRFEGGPRDDQLLDLALGPDGTLVATIQVGRDGNPSQGLAMYALNSNGTKLWRIDGGGSDAEIGSDGNVYCLGSYGQSYMATPSDMPPSAGEADLFIACYDRHGARRWVEREGGLSAETAVSLHLVGDRAIVAGYFSGMSPLAGKIVKPRGRTDAFVMSIPLRVQKH